MGWRALGQDGRFGLVARSVSLRVIVACSAAAAIAGVAVASCSSGQSADGSQRTVFATSPSTLPGLTDKTTVPTDEILNFGIANLANTSNAPVTIRAVKLISPSGPAIRDVTYQAYTDRGAFAPLGVQGDLPKTCPELYKPRALSSLSFAARSSRIGEVVVSFKIVKPGHYTMGEMRIDYVSAGHRYWQLYYLSVKLTAVPAASNRDLVQALKCGHGHKTGKG